MQVLPGRENRHRHLMTTVKFYKDKIAEQKDQFADELFADQREFEERVDEQSGETWQVFKHMSRIDAIKDTEFAAGEPPAFEDTMFKDFVRALRRDRKEFVRKRGSGAPQSSHPNK